MSEQRCGHGVFRKATAIAGIVAFASPASAGGGPSGGSVAVGAATIVSPGPTQTIVNQTTQKALINWNSFSVPAGSSVVFNQPNASALTVNRVTGQDASVIDGALSAKGAVWLLNANGVLFGQGSQVNAGALLATTSDISNANFQNGTYSFEPSPSHANASVTNAGTLQAADGGYVVLSAPDVANSGLIKANLGTVVLGGAQTFSVDMTGDNLLRYQIDAPSAQPATVSNSGTLQAAGGEVLMTARAARNVAHNVINNTGIVEATSVSSRNGVIMLDAGDDGTVNAGGTLDASGRGHGETGGTIAVTGGTVNVLAGADLDASGSTGGGTIEIGGGSHGQGPLAHAQTANVGNATLTASAVLRGDGGNVVIWSDGTTYFAGTIDARGGAQGGNGGTVETSGHQLEVAASAKVDTSAPHGTTGDWLLDPTDIYIQTGGSDGVGSTNATATIDPNTVITALGSSNVTLEASHDITVNSDVIYSSTNALTLLAQQDITVSANIQNSSTGAINVLAGWDGTTTDLGQLTTNPGASGNNSGSVTVAGLGIAVGSAGGTTTVAAYNISLNTYTMGYAQIGYRGAGGGNIVVFADNDLTMTTAYPGGNVTQIGNGAYDGTVAGTITGNVSVQVVNTLTFAGARSYPDVLGNSPASGYSASGNLSVLAGSIVDSTYNGNALATLILGAIPNNNVTLGTTASDLVLPYYQETIAPYTSSKNLTLLSSGNLSVGMPLVNAGTGNITLVSGWNTSVAAAAAVSQNAYGESGANLTIGLSGTPCDCGVGTYSGTTTVAGGNVSVLGGMDYGQIGFPGASSGNIIVDATGNLTLTHGTNAATNVALIGNGSLTNGAYGNTSGNIAIDAGGTMTLTGSVGGSGAKVWIGNIAGSGATETGSVSLITGDVSNTDNVGGSDTLAAMMLADLGTGAGSGGSFTLGVTNPASDRLADYLDAGTIDYSSPNALTFLSTMHLIVPDSIQNSGSGNLTLVAGWNSAVAPADVLTTAGAYGNPSSNNFGGSFSANAPAQLMIGGPSATGDVAVGSAGGTTSLAAAELILDSATGAAQSGYRGASGGAINMLATGYVDLIGNDSYAQIGNGTAYGANSAGGAVTLTTPLVESSYTADIVGASALFDIVGTSGGGIGSSAAPITVDVNALAIASTNGNAHFVSPSQGVTLGIGSEGISLPGTLTLNTSGTITQSVAVQAAALNLTTSSGSIALTNSGNTFGTATASAPGNVALVTSGALTIDGATAGGSVTLQGTSLAQGSAPSNAISAANVIATATAGDIVLSNNTNNFAAATLVVSGNATLVDAGAVTIDGANAGAALNVTAPSLAQGSGASNSIAAASFTANAPAGNILLANAANAVTIGTFNASGNATFSDSSALRVGAATIGGTLTLAELGTSSSTLQQDGPIQAASVVATTASPSNGAITFVNPGNRIGSVTFSTAGTSSASLGDAVSLTAGASSVGGTLALLTEGSLNFLSSIQSASGSLFAIAGWDGVTTTPAALTSKGAYGNNGGSIVVGGPAAGGAVLVGSQSGTTTIEGNTVTLAANAGAAQLGYGGAASGNIVVNASGTISLTGGSASDAFAQIGNGGFRISGNDSGSIAVTAAGNIVLDGGTGQESYAQIGQGGAESNTASAGYSDTGAIGVTAAQVVLAAGTGTGAYAQIGSGGYRSGQSLSGGTVTLASPVTLNAVSGVTLTGNGPAAYAQIGNGGDQVDSGAASGTAGTIGGNIVVAVSAPASGNAVTLTAGTGTASYVQIGNGGSGENAPRSGASDSFTISGNVQVSDLTLTGGATDAYAQVGNGDASLLGSGNVSGNITISAGTIVVVSNGTAPGGGAAIADETGSGSVSGTVTGYTAPTTVTGTTAISTATAQSNGAIAATLATASAATAPASANLTPGPILANNAASTADGTASDSGATGTNASPADASAPSTGPASGGSDAATGTVQTSGGASESPTTSGTTSSSVSTATSSSSAAPLVASSLPQQPIGGNAPAATNSETVEPADTVTQVLSHSLDTGHKPSLASKSLIPGVLTQVSTAAIAAPRGIPAADQDFASWGNEALWRW